MFSRSGRYCRFKSDAFSRAGWRPISGNHVFLRLSWHRRAEYAVFFDYSGGRLRPLPRGGSRGRRKASGGGRFGKRVKTRWIRGPGAPNRVKNAYERCTPHGAVGRTVWPTASWGVQHSYAFFTRFGAPGPRNHRVFTRFPKRRPPDAFRRPRGVPRDKCRPRPPE